MGLAPNFQSEYLQVRTHGEGTRMGRRCLLPPYVRSGDGSLREHSFVVTGPKLFNVMSKELREFSGSLETFKGMLDSFLEGIEDKPPLPGYHNAAGGNSLIQQITHARVQIL